MILLNFFGIFPFLISKITFIQFLFSQTPQYSSVFTINNSLFTICYLLSSTSLTSATNALPLADHTLAVLVFLLFLKCIKLLIASYLPEKRDTLLFPSANLPSYLHWDPHSAPTLLHCERSALASTESNSPPHVLPSSPSCLIMQFHTLTPVGPVSLSIRSSPWALRHVWWVSPTTT